MLERFIGRKLPSWVSTLTAVFTVALLIRMIFVFTLQDGFYFADGWKYTEAADHILQFGMYPPSFDRAPGYPVFLSVVYALIGDSFIGVRIVQAIMGAIIAVLIAQIGRRAGGYGCGAVAGLLWGIYPMGVFIAGTLYPTTLLTLLLACATLCLVSKPDDPGYTLKIGAAGLLLGLCALTKPIVLGSIAFVTFWLLVHKRPERWMLVCVFLLTSILALLPWTVRNYQIYGRLVPIESRGLERVVPWAVKKGGRATGSDQVSTSIDNNTVQAIPKQENTGKIIPKASPKVAHTLPKTNSTQLHKTTVTVPPQTETENEAIFDAEIEAMLIGMAKRFPREFVSFFELYPRRVGFLKQEQRERARRKNPELVRYIIFGSDLVMSVSILSVGSLYLFALIGIQAMWRDKAHRRDLGLFFLLVMSFALGYATSWGKIRYRIPVDPYIIILSAWGIMYLSNTIFKKKSQQLEEQHPAG